VQNSGDWDARYRCYYDGQSLVEVRRYFDAPTSAYRVVKQYAWGTRYVDELVCVAVNIDPEDTNESNRDACERRFYAPATHTNSDLNGACGAVEKLGN
jgi:hypothetical protein